MVLWDAQGNHKRCIEMYHSQWLRTF